MIWGGFDDRLRLKLLFVKELEEKEFRKKIALSGGPEEGLQF